MLRIGPWFHLGMIALEALVALAYVSDWARGSARSCWPALYWVAAALITLAAWKMATASQ